MNRAMHDPFRFRFANNVPTNAPQYYGFNRLPTRTLGLPDNYFDRGTGKHYQTLMDQEMHAERSRTGTRATYNDYKAAFYRAERLFRQWLVAQPPQACFDFVRDFGDYNGRVDLMVERYEGLRSGQPRAPCAKQRA
jgi:hypothetical protein